MLKNTKTGAINIGACTKIHPNLLTAPTTLQSRIRDQSSKRMAIYAYLYAPSKTTNRNGTMPHFQVHCAID